MAVTPSTHSTPLSFILTPLQEIGQKLFCCNGKKVTVLSPTNIKGHCSPELPLVESSSQMTQENIDERRRNGQILPPELLTLIFLKLDQQNLNIVRNVCKYWGELTTSSNFSRSLIQRGSINELASIPIKSTNRDVIPVLIPAWEQQLKQLVTTAPVSNGLSTLTIPQQWKINPEFSQENRDTVNSLFNKIIFEKIVDDVNHYDEFENTVSFYQDRDNPTQFSIDFCKALCQGINLREDITGLSITSDHLKDEHVNVIAENLQNGKIRYLRLYGNFNDDGMHALIESLPQMIARDNPDNVQIDILVATCQEETKSAFQEQLISLGISGQIIVKSESTLYDFP